MSDSSFDPLWGGEAIAADLFPNTKPDEQKAVLRKTYYMLERGLIPARKVGSQWVAERSSLRAAITGEAQSEM